MRLQDIISEDSGALGPGTDLVISLVAVLVMMLAINSEQLREALADLKSHEELIEELEKKDQLIDSLNIIAIKYLEEQEVLDRIKTNQDKLIDEVKNLGGLNFIRLSKNHFAFRATGINDYDIQIINDFHQQRITFGSNILFEPDQIHLKEKGDLLLKEIGEIINKRKNLISEIQIQGHADTRPTGRHGTNLNLAAKRAIEVYTFFKDVIRLSPSENLMSITSYGEYKPVERKVETLHYNLKKLKAANNDDAMRKVNRRIEIILTYRKN